MPELGLFPLGIVLLPTERIPLHIFEPRYKELIEECLAENGEFGLIHADDDGLRSVGTRARVTDVLRRFEDGKLDIVVEGGERFRLLQLTSGRSFQTGEVEPLVDEEARGDDERARVLELYRSLAEAADAEIDEPDADSPLLSFALAARVEFDAASKQRLLELRSEAKRLRLLGRMLERAHATLERAREQRERASQNGRVTPD